MKKLGLVLGLLVLPVAQAAQGVGNAGAEDITYIEQLHFDGTNLHVVYGLQARCKNPAEHQTNVRLVPFRFPLKGYQVIVTDRETRYCSDRPAFIRLAETLNLRAIVDRQRGSDQSNYSLTLPQVTYTNRAPQAWNPYGQTNPVPGQGGSGENGGTANPGEDVSYAFRCVLYKKDGARRDGFTGIDPDLSRARQKAAQYCQYTNNPNCDYWSKHPDHTTCDVVDEETEQPAKVGVEWSCQLWKRDGAKKDGFTGWGSTELEARAQSAKGCQRTNNPRCQEWSKNPDHTACTAKISGSEE